MFFKDIAKKTATALAGVFITAACALPITGCDALNGLLNPEKPPVIYEESELLKDIYEDYFPIGAAVSTNALNSYEKLMPHFNSVTAEWQMKWAQLEPSEGKYSYQSADSIVEWAKQNGKKVRGHCLVWYKSLPSWLKKKVTSKTAALNYIDRYVNDTIEHFGDDVYVWDVANEVLHNSVSQTQLDGKDYYRTGAGEVAGENDVDWYALCGVDFIKQAFRSAANARDRLNLDDLDLYYNDYNLNSPTKRSACVEMVKMLQQDGIAIDGVGMQAHYRLPDYQANPEAFMKEFEDSVKAFTELGVDVQITELDISVHASNTAPSQFDNLPLEVEMAQAQMFADIFEVCRRYSTPWKSGAGTVTGVTTWGVADDRHWLNDYHKDYPLIFGREQAYKRAYYEITAFD